MDSLRKLLWTEFLKQTPDRKTIWNLQMRRIFELSIKIPNIGRIRPALCNLDSLFWTLSNTIFIQQ